MARSFTELAGRRRVQIAALLALIFAAVVGPRVLALHDVPMTASMGFEDVNNHLLNLDLRHRLGRLDQAQLSDPYLNRQAVDLLQLNPEGWPPGVYTVARPWVGLFGPLSLWTTQLTNLVFWAVLLLGVVGLGWRMVGLRFGLWAALLAALCPGLVSASWYFTLDFPLAAMTTVGLLLLWRTGRFGCWRGCLAFAVWSAAGVLVKPPYAMHMVLPTLLVLGLGLWRGPARWLRLALGAATAGLSLGLIWLVQPEVLRGIALEVWIHTTVPPPEENIDFEFITVQPWSLHGILSVPVFVAMKHNLALLVLALPGLVLAHVRRARLPARPALLSFLWGTYIILTLLVHRQGRYCLPLYPVICLLTAWWVWTLVSRRWRARVMALVTAAFCATLWLDHRAPQERPWDRDWFRPLAASGYREMRLPSAVDLARLRAHTYHQECDLRPVIRGIAAMSNTDGSRLTLGVGTAMSDFYSSEYLALLVRQVIRDRLVTWIDHKWHKREPPPATVLFVHPPGFDLGKLGALTRVRHERGVLRCSANRKSPYRLTLLKRTAPIP